MLGSFLINRSPPNRSVCISFVGPYPPPLPCSPALAPARSLASCGVRWRQPGTKIVAAQRIWLQGEWRTCWKAGQTQSKCLLAANCVSSIDQTTVRSARQSVCLQHLNSLNLGKHSSPLTRSPSLFHLSIFSSICVVGPNQNKVEKLHKREVNIVLFSLAIIVYSYFWRYIKLTLFEFQVEIFTIQ